MKEWIKNVAWTVWVIVGLVILLIISCIVAWYRGQGERIIPKTVYVPTTEIKEVIKLKRVEIPVEKIVVIEKDAASKTLDLPPEIRNDASKQITATGVIPPYEGKTNVLAVIDTGTGVSSILAKQEPLQAVDFISNRHIGLRGGIDFDNGYCGELYASYDFLRIMSTTIGLYGEIETDDDGLNGKAMIQLDYKW